MEKETFYEKLQKLEPTVKAYLDAKKIADMPESIYVREKCGASIPCLDSNSRRAEEEKSLVSTLKIIRIIMAVAAVWGVICVIIGIANWSGMDIALGVGICVGAFFLHRHFDGKFKEQLNAIREQVARENEYNEQLEKARAEHRAIIADMEAKEADMKVKFEQIGLASVFSYGQSYESFSNMLSYAKNHPKQTTPGPYLKEVEEKTRAYYHKLYMKSIETELALGDRNYSDTSVAEDLESVLERDREERFRHDLEMQRREEEARHSAELRERQRAWDEKKKQEAQERIDHRKKNWEEINERSRLEKELRHQCNTCSLSSKCYMRGSFPCPTYRPR